MLPMYHARRLAVAVALAVVSAAACSGKKPGPASYEFTSVRRGSIERTVSSSGTIKPVSTVNVLPRMSGKVEKINVDYNDPVSVGDVLAELNTDMLRLKWEQQYASVIKARANYELQEINYRNQVALAEKNLISEYELRTSRTQLDGERADLAVAESNLKVTQTEINQYAFITSPINGIVLDRNINIGDTVVDSSSNNSSSIFTLAENLREMQIEAMVGELDVTSIYKGQGVRFTLESLPGRSFSGEVETLRMVPVVSNNIVSYTVVINVENHDGSLLPGMTCAVDFIVEQAENVLLVSNAALRYQPTTLDADRIAEMVFTASLAAMNDEQRQAAIEAREQQAKEAQSAAKDQNAGGGLTGLMTGNSAAGRRMWDRMIGQEGGTASAVVMRNLWYINGDGRLEVMQVEAGITNGSFTEIRPLVDIEGKQVIMREKI